MLQNLADEGGLSEEELPEFDERAQPWFDRFESFALTSAADGDWSITTGLLTLR